MSKAKYKLTPDYRGKYTMSHADSGELIHGSIPHSAIPRHIANLERPILYYDASGEDVGAVDLPDYVLIPTLQSTYRLYRNGALVRKDATPATVKSDILYLETGDLYYDAEGNETEAPS